MRKRGIRRGKSTWIFTVNAGRAHDFGHTAEVDGTIYEVPFGAGIVCGNGLMVFIWD
jgi:predicted methyltransferase MtxX (methanogen marker protein 4)